MYLMSDTSDTSVISDTTVIQYETKPAIFLINRTRVCNCYKELGRRIDRNVPF